ncbi:MAG: CRR6 family NdhI maturation factor [Leptolyngbya sp. SIO4C5]|uniref:CRR6 family NdhI maturation factor n=1 Tax=Sphaerothrix gracilis TaxID=3151835 RepID=UPI0013C277E2|nr:CRR6 family NdhI maturation factor [Leptolyngbya sp. SIO4C5]
MPTAIALSQASLNTLDLTPAQTVLEPLLADLDPVNQDINLRFEIDYPRDPTDPRELSEIPEVRLWFIRLDTLYPWLPLILDWEAGELGRYAAMLVPHQFSPREGIRYNPEALEIFVMRKVFDINHWLQAQGITSRTRLKFMTQMLGYELDDAFFQIL